MSAIGMPAHILAYFAPRPPLERVSPPPKKLFKPYTGLAEFLDFENTPPPAVEPFEPPKERRARLQREKAAAHQSSLRAAVASYDPHADEEKIKTLNPNRTLFVGRLSYETTQKKLLKTFEEYGPVHDIRLVTDRENKPRGYAFVEFRTSEGLRTAFREANNRALDGRKLVVDVEKARTQDHWLPRRLGGGEGPPRCGVAKKVLQMRAQERRMTSYAGGDRGPNDGRGGRGREDGRGRPRGASWHGGESRGSGGRRSEFRRGGGGPRGGADWDGRPRGDRFAGHGHHREEGGYGRHNADGAPAFGRHGAEGEAPHREAYGGRAGHR